MDDNWESFKKSMPENGRRIIVKFKSGKTASGRINNSTESGFVFVFDDKQKQLNFDKNDPMDSWKYFCEDKNFKDIFDSLPKHAMITRRDYFAGLAMQIILEGWIVAQKEVDGIRVAKDAYIIADKMMNAREQISSK